jgi:outer membrane protein OmpA-like peptidoglycan-associated protein
MNINFWVALCFIWQLSTAVLWAQPQREVNLVFNGDFEEGNIGFVSDFVYNPKGAEPGQYSITDYASLLHKDFRNPIGGDNTYGDGFYLVANSDGTSGRKVWSAEVEVVPNSNYKFSVYYCNLYKVAPRKTGFAFDDGDVKGNDPTIRFAVNGKQVGELDRDFYRLYRWVHASAIWYSGKHKGPVTISIENVNYSEEGNDLAIDDIAFEYLETMPDGYIPPPLRTIMSEAYREEMAKNYRPSRRVIDFADLAKGDELAPGIFTIRYNSAKDTSLLKKGEKFQLKNLIFAQGEATLSAEGLKELDRLAAWMKKEPKVRILVEGHTDNQGRADLNIKLSEERVFNVKVQLMKLGIAEERIETFGFGGALPIADNTNEEARKLNRRVEFEVLE